MSCFKIRKALIFSFATALPFLSVNAANVPLGYSVYSIEDLKIGARGGMSGGIVGSGCNVFLGADAVVHGSIFARGNINMSERSKIEEDATLSGVVNYGVQSRILGTISQRATVPLYTIPTQTVTSGSSNVSVTWEGTGSAAPGRYNTIEAKDRSTINLSSGTYEVNSFLIGYDVKVNVNLSAGGIKIMVKNNFQFNDRAKMILSSGNGSNVEIYYHGSNGICIGYDAVAYGQITAPNASIIVKDRANFQGSVYAKRVELQPGLYSANMVDKWLQIDTDRDGAPDLVEIQAGTDVNDPTSKPATLSSGTYANKTSIAPQTVELSINHFSGYNNCTNLPITFDKGSIKGDLIPIDKIISTSDVSAPDPALPSDGTILDGQYHSIAGEVATGKKILMAFPISDENRGAITQILKLNHFNEETQAWENIPIAYTTYNAVYAWIESFSVYAITSKLYNKVQPNITVSDPAKHIFKTVAEAVAERRSRNTALDQEFYILVEGNTTILDPITISLPAKTRFIGGCDFSNSNQNDLAISDPRNKPTVFQPIAATTTGPGRDAPFLNIDPGVAPPPVPGTVAEVEIDLLIDGFTFTGSANSEGACKLDNPIFHSKNIKLFNCFFVGNSGVDAGGLYLYNVSNVLIESCIFANNSAITSNPSTLFLGSAIMIRQVSTCGVGVNIASCVFANNVTTIPTTSSIPSGTICNVDQSGLQGRELKIYQCTFFSNQASNRGSVLYTNNDAQYLALTNCIMDGNNGSESIYYPNSSSDIHVVQNFSGNPGFVDPTVPEGTDRKWGTIDDGLQLNIFNNAAKLNCINKFVLEQNAGTRVVTPTALRDAAGRLRMSHFAQTTDDHKQLMDKGAYETYIKILTIGDANTVGNNGYNYAMYLKEKMETSGLLVDYVGVSTRGFESASQTAKDYLNEDPSAPNHVYYDGTETGAPFDLQTAAYREATLSDYLTATNTIDPTISTLQFDIALVMLGRNDLFDGTNWTTGTDPLPLWTRILALTESLAQQSACGKAILTNSIKMSVTPPTTTKLASYFYNYYDRLSPLLATYPNILLTDNINNDGTTYTSISTGVLDFEANTSIAGINIANLFWNKIRTLNLLN
jgi:predicted acyltransferase (DUF342 family)